MTAPRPGPGPGPRYGSRSPSPAQASGREEAPHAPDRARLPLLPSGPGGVRQDAAAWGVGPSLSDGPEAALGWWVRISGPLARPVASSAEDSPSGLWRSLGKRVGLIALRGSNPLSSATFRSPDLRQRRSWSAGASGRRWWPGWLSSWSQSQLWVSPGARFPLNRPRRPVPGRVGRASGQVRIRVVGGELLRDAVVADADEFWDFAMFYAAVVSLRWLSQQARSASR